MIGPGPWARNFESDGSAVMLFHSWIVRIQSALPLDVVGEIEPNVSSWRTNHGTITSEIERHAADGSPPRQSRPEPSSRQPGASAIPDEDEPDREAEDEPVVAGERCEPDQEARSPCTPRASPLSPRTVSQIVAATSGWRIAKFSGWAMNTAPAAGIAARIAAPIPTARLEPASRAMNQVKRRGDGADQDRRDRGGEGRRPEDRDERCLEE